MKEIKITSNEIKQAIDDLVNENEMLQDKVYKLEDIIKEAIEIFKYYGTKEDIVGYSNYNITGEDLIRILEILDKENK